MKARNPKQLVFKMLADREMTPSDLAREMGVSRQAVSQGFRNAMSFKRVQEIADALGYDVQLQATRRSA